VRKKFWKVPQKEDLLDKLAVDLDTDQGELLLLAEKIPHTIRHRVLERLDALRKGVISQGRNRSAWNRMTPAALPLRGQNHEPFLYLRCSGLVWFLCFTGIGAATGCRQGVQGVHSDRHGGVQRDCVQ
jgi:hypothetical protein